MNKIKLSILGLAILSVQSLMERILGALVFSDNGTAATIVNIIWDWEQPPSSDSIHQ